MRGCGVTGLRHAVFPLVLASAAHDEEIAVTEVEGAGVAAPAWPESERTWCSDADDRHDRVDDGVPVPVAVPCHGVVAVAVAVEPDRVEDLVVALAQDVAHRGEDRQRLGTAAVGAPPPREARLGQPTLVHGHRPLPPRQRRAAARRRRDHGRAASPERGRARCHRRARAAAGCGIPRRSPACRPRTAIPGGRANPCSRTCVRCSRCLVATSSRPRTHWRDAGTDRGRRPRRPAPRRLRRADRPRGAPPSRAATRSSSRRARRRSSGCSIRGTSFGRCC